MWLKSLIFQSMAWSQSIWYHPYEFIKYVLLGPVSDILNQHQGVGF